jgi:hypothetical protein
VYRYTFHYDLSAIRTAEFHGIADARSSLSEGKEFNNRLFRPIGEPRSEVAELSQPTGLDKNAWVGATFMEFCSTRSGVLRFGAHIPSKRKLFVEGLIFTIVGRGQETTYTGAGRGGSQTWLKELMFGYPREIKYTVMLSLAEIESGVFAEIAIPRNPGYYDVLVKAMLMNGHTSEPKRYPITVVSTGGELLPAFLGLFPKEVVAFSPLDSSGSKAGPYAYSSTYPELVVYQIPESLPAWIQELNLPFFSWALRLKNFLNVALPDFNLALPTFGLPNLNWNLPHLGIPGLNIALPNFDFRLPNFGLPDVDFNLPNFGTYARACACVLLAAVVVQRCCCCQPDCASFALPLVFCFVQRLC